MCKYNSHYFWEGVLSNNRDPWKSCFEDLQSPTDAIFVNTVVIDYGRNTLDNNWACYPGVKSLLGFLQYIYLPMAFFYIINRECRELYIPVRSSSSFVEYVTASGCLHSKVMADSINELKNCWGLEDELCLRKIKTFCRKFNEFWKGDDLILNIGVFSNTFEISTYIRKNMGFAEVLEEDAGFTPAQLYKLCKGFYKDKFLQKTFVKILNNRIGCVI